MKLIFKLILLGILVIAVVPMIAPNSPLSGVIRAATADVMSFCDRRPDACEEGARFAQQTRESLFALVGSIGASGGPSALTQTDRALAPMQQTAGSERPLTEPTKVEAIPFKIGQQPAQPSAKDSKTSFAGHGKPITY